MIINAAERPADPPCPACGAYRWGGGAGGSVATIDGATNTVTSNLFVCCLGAPLYIDVNPLTDRAYVSLPGWSYDPADAHWVAVIADRPPAADVAVRMADAKRMNIALFWEIVLEHYTEEFGIQHYTLRTGDSESLIRADAYVSGLFSLEKA